MPSLNYFVENIRIFCHPYMKAISTINISNSARKQGCFLEQPRVWNETRGDTNLTHFLAFSALEQCMYPLHQPPQVIFLEVTLKT